MTIAKDTGPRNGTTLLTGGMATQPQGLRSKLIQVRLEESYFNNSPLSAEELLMGPLSGLVIYTNKTGRLCPKKLGEKPGDLSVCSPPFASIL